MKRKLNYPHPDDPDYTGPGYKGLAIINLNEKVQSMYGKDTDIQFDIEDDITLLTIYINGVKKNQYQCEGIRTPRDWVFIEEEDIKRLVMESLIDIRSVLQEYQ